MEKVVNDVRGVISIMDMLRHYDAVRPESIFQVMLRKIDEEARRMQVYLGRKYGHEGVLAENPEILQRLMDGKATHEDLDRILGLNPVAPTLGWQIADSFGENIQGDTEDPTGLPSFRILHAAEAMEALRRHNDLLLMPIREGDIENPEFPPETTGGGPKA